MRLLYAHSGSACSTCGRTPLARLWGPSLAMHQMETPGGASYSWRTTGPVQARNAGWHTLWMRRAFSSAHGTMMVCGRTYRTMSRARTYAPTSVSCHVRRTPSRNHGAENVQCIQFFYSLGRIS
jgi:hypothetical protein